MLIFKQSMTCELLCTVTYINAEYATDIKEIVTLIE